MKIEELITALRRLKVETGSLPCLGCGYEHGCSLHGCVIINEALERITMLKEHFSEESALKMAAQALETTPEALRQSAQFHAGDTVWVLTRDEDGVPDDVDGYMLLAVAGNAVIVTSFVDDRDDLDSTLAYHIRETAVNFDSDLAVFPLSDCYAVYEAARAALDVESEGIWKLWSLFRLQGRRMSTIPRRKPRRSRKRRRRKLSGPRPKRRADV